MFHISNFHRQIKSNFKCNINEVSCGVRITEYFSWVYASNSIFMHTPWSNRQNIFFFIWLRESKPSNSGEMKIR